MFWAAFLGADRDGGGEREPWGKQEEHAESDQEHESTEVCILCREMNE